jgi:hypothetical protein
MAILNIFQDLPSSENVAHGFLQNAVHTEAVEKWNWLRAGTAPNPENIASGEVPVPICSQPHRA